jgi:hypothetical protein
MYFHGNRCYKFDGTWDEFQEYIHEEGLSTYNIENYEHNIF